MRLTKLLFLFLFFIPVHGDIEGSGNDDDEEEEIVFENEESKNLKEAKTNFESASVAGTKDKSSESRNDDDLFFEADNLEVIRSEESRPRLLTKLPKLPVTIGKATRWKIPRGTFIDGEDGGTRQLRITLRHHNGSAIAKGTWVRLDEAQQELFFLPVDESDIGRWQFILTATDRRGQGASDTLEVVVRQYTGIRLINHEFNLLLSISSRRANTITDWKWMVLDAVRRLYGASNTDHLLVRSATRSGALYRFSWTNITLAQGSCPRQLIEHNLKSLIDSQTRPRPALKLVLGPEVQVRSVNLDFLGVCLEPQQTTNGDEQQQRNSVPRIKRPIERINVTAGELLRFRVPSDTCEDNEDGNTRQLSLQLLTVRRRELPAHFWLKFDTSRQEVIGVPLEEEVGREAYQLVCSDQAGLSAIDNLEVLVLNRPFSERFGVEFVLSFDKDISSKKIELIEMIADFFGDKNTNQVVLKTLIDDNYSLVWVNKSLAFAACNDPALLQVARRLDPTYYTETDVGKNDNDFDVSEGTGIPSSPVLPPIPSDLALHFDSLELIDAAVIRKDRCINAAPGIQITKEQHEDNEDGLELWSLLRTNSVVALPLLAILVMVSLALCVACVLRNRRKAGKLFYSETLPPRVPVILREELFSENKNEGQSNKEAQNLLTERPAPAYNKYQV